MIGNTSISKRVRPSSSSLETGNDKHDGAQSPTTIPKDVYDNPNVSKDEYLQQLVRDTHKEATRIRCMRRSEALKTALLESRDLVLQQQTKQIKRRQEGISKRHIARVYPRLPSTECSNPDIFTHSQTVDDRTKNSNKSSTYQIKLCDSKKSKKWTQVENHQPLYIESTMPSNPPSTSTVFLKGQYAVEDMEDLIHVPYFNDDDENVISEHFCTRRREKLMEDGPLYIKKATDDAIDETLTLLLYNKKNDLFNGGRRRTELLKRSSRRDRRQFDDETVRNNFTKRIQHHVAKTMNVTIDRVVNRYNVLQGRQTISSSAEVLQENHTSTSDNDNGPQTRTVYNSEEICKLCKDAGSEAGFTYSEHVMDSFRNLFCRRCYTYDCNNHGNMSQPGNILQTKLAVEKECNGDWDDSITNIGGVKEIKKVQEVKTKSQNIRMTRSMSVVAAKEVTSQQEDEALDGMQKIICDHVFQIFQGDTERIAAVIGCNPKSLRSYIKEKSIRLNNPVHKKEQFIAQEPKKKKRKVSDKKSMKCYNPCWLKRVRDTELHPPFDQCNHDEPCSFETCSCIQNAFFCTKHCTWGDKSRNFFRGCSCKVGQCRTLHCPCFAAKRECDPDLCHTCGACTDPPNEIARTQRCRNDNIGMRRHCHLLLAKSGVLAAGWGIYTKYALKKGDFIQEYVGEIISQEEAERRGAIYDKENRSYLFNLSSEDVIDARKKGNKTKFANHSSTPNCCTKVITVNGDSKVGLFAKEDIEAQTELFFDYRYDVSVTHASLLKPSMTVEWMKKSKAVKKTST